jgi:hypothetical protein
MEARWWGFGLGSFWYSLKFDKNGRGCVKSEALLILALYQHCVGAKIGRDVSVKDSRHK